VEVLDLDPAGAQVSAEERGAALVVELGVPAGVELGGEDWNGGPCREATWRSARIVTSRSTPSLRG
jgi:hypothetical protein